MADVNFLDVFLGGHFFFVGHFFLGGHFLLGRHFVLDGGGGRLMLDFRKAISFSPLVILILPIRKRLERGPFFVFKNNLI